jgi:hypothetical protein
MKSMKNFNNKIIKNTSAIKGGDRKNDRHKDKSNIITINIYDGDRD